MTKQQLTAAIRSCINRGDHAFVPYIMAGDGGLHKLKETILFLQEIGVTAIELGIPFSDPVADGPEIQAAGERALLAGVTLRKVLQEIGLFKEEVTIPLVFMTYLNPVIRYGIDQFASDCAKNGVSGLIIPDLPYEESGCIKEALSKHDLALIPLVSLTSQPARIEKILRAGEGFIYAVTVNGITGVREGFGKVLDRHLKQLKEGSPVPVLAGFGISTPEQVANMGQVVDGVIVGSAIVKALHHEDFETVRQLVAASKKKRESMLNLN